MMLQAIVKSTIAVNSVLNYVYFMLPIAYSSLLFLKLDIVVFDYCQGQLSVMQQNIVLFLVGITWQATEVFESLMLVYLLQWTPVVKGRRFTILGPLQILCPY